MKRPEIALRAKAVPSAESALRYAREKAYRAVDWSLTSEDLLLARDGGGGVFARALAGADGLEMRYHCFLEDVEIAHVDSEVAAASLGALKLCVDEIRGFGGRHMTVHIGLNAKPEEISWETAVNNLGSLVEYARGTGVVVCLENLGSGLTSEPEPFLRLIELTGAKVTFDLGHANSSPHSGNGAGALDFLKMASPHVVNAHIYEREDPHHIAPEDLSFIAPMLDHLLNETRCGWWVIELEDRQEVERTRALLQIFMSRPVLDGA